ncbi:putative zeaxanthin epoxidase [Helianthus annuus]|nr:putative zeaxanthin epoxidase [Helianthus annuus]KAJ0746531.1 putative zeaxanthin epoxidase [Helianthus annuus]KAJ0749906.1 putative zeaxanthin epoxidase [Helianthus annuus]KAJ0788712.1 putative zeaxanthin epoxidase [Helianthus annuus]
MAKKEMEVVKGIDLKRYMGRWYEIASFPSFFQPRNGENTRATYTLNEDGIVHVLNETWSNDKRDYIEGTAYKADPKSDEAKLKVKFYVPPFLPIIPVVGDYWVLYLDEDYTYALIGEPRRKYLWILCRNTHLDEDIYNQLVEKVKEEGYDVSKLKRTPQADPPPAENGRTDTRGVWWIKSLFGK